MTGVPSQKPVPTPDEDSRPYWEGINQGKFLFQRCETCGKPQFYSRSLCSHCQSSKLHWEEACGRARVASYTVVHRAPIRAFSGDTPYVLALIDLEEGIRLMCNVINCDAEAVSIGMPVTIVFQAIPGSTQKIPQAQPV